MSNRGNGGRQPGRPSTPPPGRWPAGQECYFAGSRTGCEGLAVVCRGTITLCRSCSAQASSLAREPERPVPSPAQLLEQAGRLQVRLEELTRERDAMAAAAVAAGANYAVIGRALGVTRQAARQRFGQPAERL